MSAELLAAAGKIADAIAEFYGTDRDQLVVADTFGAAIIGPETMEPWNWASEWPTFLSHQRLLTALKVEVMTTADANMAVRLRSAGPKPIIWSTGRYGSIRGEVGGTELFTISAATDHSGNYLLSTRLPVYVRTPFDTEGDAKAGAERLLAAFVVKLTA